MTRPWTTMATSPSVFAGNEHVRLSSDGRYATTGRQDGLPKCEGKTPRGGLVRDHAEGRHYEDCWNKLARMFASTQVLPPRTKRWAEAKVLADCVAMRVSATFDRAE